MKDFSFDEKISKDFENHIKNSIPGYEEVLKMCVDFSEWFIRGNSNVYDLGSSKGTLLKMLQERYKNRERVSYKGIETQKGMYCSNYEADNIFFENKDITTIEHFDNASIIYSLFTIQFLPEDKRFNLLEVIYNSLPEGGLFLMAEKFNSKNSRISEIKKSLLLESKLKNGFTAEEILEKDRSLRGVMNLNSLDKSFDNFSKLGFSEYETIYLNNNFALYACIK